MLFPRFSNPPDFPHLWLPFAPSSFPMSVTVYCIVGSFTRHLLLSLYSDAMYRKLLQLLYQIIFFLFLDVGESFFILVLFIICIFGCLQNVLFFVLIHFEIFSQKRTERRDLVIFLCHKKDCSYLF